jgi:DNA-binding response OmpR family regulator
MNSGPKEADENSHTPRVVTDQPSPAPRVLVIDDEATIRVALRRFFTRLGWSVDDASSGEVALEKLLNSEEAQPYRLVICDLRMPGVNGIDLHDRLAELRPDILDRVIFSTGDVVSEEVADFIETTACLVLQKPFELSALLETVKRIDDRNDHSASGSG